MQDLVESSRSQYGRVDDVRPIRGRHEEDPAPRFDSVHFRQQLVDDSRPRSGVAVLGTARAQGVDLVEKDDARRRISRPLEARSHRPLRLAHVLRKNGKRKHEPSTPIKMSVNDQIINELDLIEI